MSQRIIGALMILLLMSSNITLVSRAQTPEESLLLTREEAAQMILDKSYSLELLEVEEISLMNDFADAVEEARTMSDLYDQLGTYEYLDNLYDTTMANDDYEAYLNLLLEGIGDGREDDLAVYLEEIGDEISAAEAEASGDSETDASEVITVDDELYQLYEDIESRIAYEASFTDTDYSAMLTTSQYYTYLSIVEDFEDAGLYTSEFSDQETYDTFIYTMDVVPLTLQSDIKVFQSQEKVERQSLVNNVHNVYDTALTAILNEEAALEAYEAAVTALKEAEDYLALGKITSATYTYAEYEVETALLTYENMKRSAENSLLDLKFLLGLEPDLNLSLDGSQESIEIADYEVYVLATLESPAIDQLLLQIKYGQWVMEIMEEYLGESSDEYEEQFEAVSDLEEDLAQLEETSLTATRVAYNSVMTAYATITYNEAVYEVYQAKLDRATFMYGMGYRLWGDVVDQDDLMTSLNRSMAMDQMDLMSAIRSLEYTSGMYVYGEE